MATPFQASALHEHLDQKGYCEKLRKIATAMQPYHFLQNEVKELGVMVDSADSAFNVAVFGYMKTGKSSLINAYIGETRAIVGVTETTATINKIAYGDGDRLRQFVVHWNGKPRETYGIERLSEWIGTDEAALERIKRVSYLELFSNIAQLKDVNIIDTPGMGANVDVHNKAAEQFISGRQADAIVYVLDVGRESAVDSLKTFKRTCLEGTKPYNSMAVLHKWDSIYWGNDGNYDEIRAMARDMKENLHGLVADVLPVSAPLALVAKVATDDFWLSAIQVLSTFEDESKLLRKLKYDETYWATSEDRMNLWQTAKRLCQLPWPCFKVMLRELYRDKTADAAQARKIILGLSGIEAFERCLCSEFFEQRGLIRMRQLRAHAQSVLSSMNRRIHADLDSRKHELYMTSRACDEIRSKDLHAWFDERLTTLRSDFELLDKSWYEFDKEVKQLAEIITYSDNLLTIRRWLDSGERLPFSPEQVVFLQHIVKSVLYAQIDNDVQNRPEQKTLVNLLTHVSGMSKTHPNRKFRQYALTLEDVLHKYKAEFC